MSLYKSEHSTCLIDLSCKSLLGYCSFVVQLPEFEPPVIAKHILGPLSFSNSGVVFTSFHVSISLLYKVVFFNISFISVEDLPLGS